MLKGKKLGKAIFVEKCPTTAPAKILQMINLLWLVDLFGKDFEFNQFGKKPTHSTWKVYSNPKFFIPLSSGNYKILGLKFSISDRDRNFSGSRLGLFAYLLVSK